MNSNEIPVISITELISLFIPNVSPKLLSLKAPADSGATMKSIMKANEELRPILNDLKTLILCSYCDQNKPTVFLTCGHNLCTKCTVEKVTEQTEGKICVNAEEIHKRPLCPKRTCRVPMRSKCFSHCFSDWEARKSAAEERLTNRDPYKFCVGCSKRLSPDCFYPEIKLCHRLCKLCIANTVTKSPQCPKCNQPLTPNIFRAQITCSGCTQTLTISSANLICNHHQFCYKCFKDSMLSSQCFLCNESIGTQALQAGLKRLYNLCDSCKKLKESVFIQKNSSGKSICFSCNPRNIPI